MCARLTDCEHETEGRHYPGTRRAGWNQRDDLSAPGGFLFDARHDCKTVSRALNFLPSPPSKINN
jgi:hypothetical protein